MKNIFFTNNSYFNNSIFTNSFNLPLITKNLYSYNLINIIEYKKLNNIPKAEEETYKKQQQQKYKNSPNKLYMFNIGKLRFYEDVSHIKKLFIENYNYDQNKINYYININYDLKNIKLEYINITKSKPAQKIQDTKIYKRIKKTSLKDISIKTILYILHSQNKINKNRLNKILKHNKPISKKEKEHINQYLNTTLKKRYYKNNSIKALTYIERDIKSNKERIKLNGQPYNITIKTETTTTQKAIKESNLHPEHKIKLLNKITQEITKDAQNLLINSNKYIIEQTNA